MRGRFLPCQSIIGINARQRWSRLFETYEGNSWQGTENDNGNLGQENHDDARRPKAHVVVGVVPFYRTTTMDVWRLGILILGFRLVFAVHACHHDAWYVIVTYHTPHHSMKPVYVASRSKLFSNVHTSHLVFQVHVCSCVDEFVHHFPVTTWRCKVKWWPPSLQERRRGGD